MNGELFITPAQAQQRFVEVLVKQQSVWQTGEPVMARHIADAFFGLAFFCHVHHDNELCKCITKHDVAPRRENVNLAPIGLDMPPNLTSALLHMRIVPNRFLNYIPLVLRHYVEQAHCHKSFLGIAVMRYSGIVHSQKFQAVPDCGVHAPAMASSLRSRSLYGRHPRMPADQNGDLFWNRGALTPPKSVAGIVDDANNGHLLGNVQCEGYVCLHSVAQASGLMAEWGCGTSAARQKSTIWSRTGSNSCSYSTIRRG